MVKGAVQLIPGSGVNLQYHAKMPYPAETEPVRFLFMGRIRREKGIEEFLAAAEAITRKPFYSYDGMHLASVVLPGGYEQCVVGVLFYGTTYNDNHACGMP